MEELSKSQLTTASNLPLLHSSLKLYAKLRIIKDSKDANEDIVDSWNDSGDGAVHCLVALLKTPQGMSERINAAMFLLKVM